MMLLVILATVLAVTQSEAPSGGYRITDVGPNYRGYGGGSRFQPIGDRYGPPAYSLPPVPTTTTTTTTNRPTLEYGLPNQPFYIPPPQSISIEREYGTPQRNFSPGQPAIPTTKTTSSFEIYRVPVQTVNVIPNFTGSSAEFIQSLVKEFGSEVPKISNEYGTPRRSEVQTHSSQSLPQPQPIPDYSVPPTNLYNTPRESHSQNLSPDLILDLAPPL